MRKGAPRRLSRQATRTSFSRRNFIADERPGRSEVAPDIVSVNIRSQLGLAERIISLKGSVLFRAVDILSKGTIRHRQHGLYWFHEVISIGKLHRNEARAVCGWAIATITLAQRNEMHCQ